MSQRIEDIRTADAIFYRETLQAFTQASLAAWREQEAAERQRRADLMACYLEDVWTREELNNG
jgi:hypothetical protein